MRHVGDAQHIAQFRELPVVADRDDEVAVSSREALVGRQIGMAVAHPHRHHPARHPVEGLVAQDRDLRVEQRHVDMRARAGARAVVQRRQDRNDRVDAGEQVGEGNPALLRQAVRLAGDRHDPAHPLDDEVVAGAVRIGAVLSEAGDRADDQPRIGGAQRGGVEAVFDEPADLVILDHHVRARRQIADPRLPVRRGDVDRDRPLAAVAGVVIGRGQVFAGRAGQERRAPVAGVVALAGAFHLDDVGAQIGEQLPGPWPGEDAGEFEDADARERSGRYIGHRAGVAGSRLDGTRRAP